MGIKNRLRKLFKNNAAYPGPVPLDIVNVIIDSVKEIEDILDEQKYVIRDLQDDVRQMKKDMEKLDREVYDVSCDCEMTRDELGDFYFELDGRIEEIEEKIGD